MPSIRAADLIAGPGVFAWRAASKLVRRAGGAPLETRAAADEAGSSPLGEAIACTVIGVLAGLRLAVRAASGERAQGGPAAARPLRARAGAPARGAAPPGRFPGSPRTLGRPETATDQRVGGTDGD